MRPEQLRITVGNGGSGPADRGGSTGEVIDTQFYGHGIVMMVALDEPQGAEPVIVRAVDDLAAPVGTRVGLSVIGPVHAWAR